MGYVSWIGKYEEEDSYLVTLLAKAGAVFYVKTNVPQSLMVCETVNNIIGRTVNPRNKNWSCGGSSGGEGAMVGFRGGIIGVGTDIGQSKLRNPGHLSDVPRWIYSHPVCIQLSLRHQTQPRKAALRQNGKLHGGSRDCSLCLWASHSLSKR